jgi:hypothetical protein
MTAVSPAETPVSTKRAKTRIWSFGWWLDAGVVALAGAIVTGLMTLSVVSPLHNDDYKGLVDIAHHPFLDLLAQTYSGWMGRLTPALLGDLALRFRFLWGIANGGAFVALVVLSFAVAVGRWPRMVRRDIAVLVLVLAAYWFALPITASTVFWRSGAPNYLWPMVLLLLFAFPYRKWMSSARGGDSSRAYRVVASLACFVLGFFVGCSHEQLILALCVLFVALAVKVRQRGLRQVPVELLAGLAGAVIGAVVLVLAPGNEVRMAAEGGLSLTAPERLGLLKAYVEAAVLRWLPGLVPWLLGILAATVLMIGVTPAPNQRAHRHRAWWVWGLAGLATLAPFAITAPQPASAERTFFFFCVFLTVAVLSLAGDGKRRVLDFIPSTVVSGVIAVVMLFLLVSVAANVHGAMLIDKALNIREQAIAVQKADGVKDVVVAPIAFPRFTAFPYQPLTWWDDLTPDPAAWQNEAQAEWYGVNTIRAEGPVTIY